MKLLHWFSNLLYPQKCVLCGKLLQKQETDLCHRCRIEAPECPVNSSKYPYLNSWVALWYYEGEVRRSLLRYKFYGKRHYAAIYARLLGMKLLREDKADFDVMTYIPISAKHRRKRGFDQVELLAQKLGAELGIAPKTLLKKVRDNPAQSGIVGQAERRANVLGAYVVLDPEFVQGKRILLLDDIVTTGSTAAECARVLLTAGAKEVHFAVIAAARQHKKVVR